VKEQYVVVELAEGVRVKVKQDTILDLQNKD
jgi:preprotein translocase subunit YajC